MKIISVILACFLAFSNAEAVVSAPIVVLNQAAKQKQKQELLQVQKQNYTCFWKVPGKDRYINLFSAMQIESSEGRIYFYIPGAVLTVAGSRTSKDLTSDLLIKSIFDRLEECK